MRQADNDFRLFRTPAPNTKHRPSYMCLAATDRPRKKEKKGHGHVCSPHRSNFVLGTIGFKENRDASVFLRGACGVIVAFVRPACVAWSVAERHARGRNGRHPWHAHGGGKKPSETPDAPGRSYGSPSRKFLFHSFLSERFLLDLSPGVRDNVVTPVAGQWPGIALNWNG